MLEGVSGGFESSATGGKAFAMEKVRTYDGPRIDFDSAAMSPFSRSADEEMCERWAVLTSIFQPTETVNQLAGLSEPSYSITRDQFCDTFSNDGGVVPPTVQSCRFCAN